MAEYVSGEEYKAIKNKPTGRSGRTAPKHVTSLAVVLVIVAGLSFYAGTAYQKSKQPKTTASASGFAASGNGGFGRRFNGQRPTIGQVTAISATSITVQDSRTGSSTMLSITSSTLISNNGQTASASDIQTGNTVLITASTSDKTQAARILINPSFGGPGAGGGSGASGSSSNTPDDSSNSVTN